MTRFGLTAPMLAAGVLLWSSTANANMITVNAQVTGGSVVTLASGPSPLSVPNTTVGNFTVGGLAQGTPPLDSGSFLTDAIVVKSGGPGTTLTIWFTETGITSPTGDVPFTSGLTSNLISSGWSAKLSTFLDTGNAVAPPLGNTPLATATFTTNNTSTSTKTVPTGAGPYSLQEVYAITVGGGPGNANLTIDLMAPVPPPVPEPSTLALLGSGLLVGVGVLRRRR